MADTDVNVILEAASTAAAGSSGPTAGSASPSAPTWAKRSASATRSLTGTTGLRSASRSSPVARLLRETSRSRSGHNQVRPTDSNRAQALFETSSSGADMPCDALEGCVAPGSSPEEELACLAVAADVSWWTSSPTTSTSSRTSTQSTSGGLSAGDSTNGTPYQKPYGSAKSVTWPFGSEGAGSVSKPSAALMFVLARTLPSGSTIQPVSLYPSAPALPESVR